MQILEKIDLVKYRIKAEYDFDVMMHPLPFSAARWISAEQQSDLDSFLREQQQNICRDSHQNPTLLLDHEWRLKYHMDRHPKIVFKETA